MCLGKPAKRKTAEDFYQEMKKDYGPLPSTSIEVGGKREQGTADVPSPQMRTTAVQSRSLLRMQNGGY